MRRNNHIAFFGCYLITAFTVLFLCSTDALAAETTKNCAAQTPWQLKPPKTGEPLLTW
jgi:hypothetical protein